MPDSDPNHAAPGNDAPANAVHARLDALRAEIAAIDGKLDGPTLDLQTKMEMKARKQTLERQVRDLEKKQA